MIVLPGVVGGHEAGEFREVGRHLFLEGYVNDGSKCVIVLEL